MGTSKKDCYSGRMKQILFLASVLCFPGHWAHSVDKAKLPTQKKFSLEKLQKTYKNAASIEADLIQEVYKASLGQTKTSNGNIKLSKPNLVRWETLEPEASVLVSNGRKVFYFIPNARGKGKGQVNVSTANKLETQPLFRILTGTSPLGKEFTVEKQAEVESVAPGEKWTELVLRPRKKWGDIQQVQLKVDAKYLIRELTTETEIGNKTKITLQNQVLGAKLPPALFDFKPPADTEVLQN